VVDALEGNELHRDPGGPERSVPLVKTPFTIITKDNLNQPAVQQAVYSF